MTKSRRAVVAKFRCLTRSENWGDTVKYHLAPIARDKGKDPENELFWKYTPSGSFDITYHSKDDPGLKPGAYYLLHLTPMESKAKEPDDGDVELTCLRLDGTSSTITFSIPWRSGRSAHGKLEMTVSTDAFPDAPATFGNPSNEESRWWRLDITFSEPSDD